MNIVILGGTKCMHVQFQDAKDTTNYFTTNCNSKISSVCQVKVEGREEYRLIGLCEKHAHEGRTHWKSFFSTKPVMDRKTGKIMHWGWPFRKVYDNLNPEFVKWLHGTEITKAADDYQRYLKISKIKNGIQNMIKKNGVEYDDVESMFGTILEEMVIEIVSRS